jgi:pantothenate synthetase
VVESEPLATLDYAEVVDADTLAPLERLAHSAPPPRETVLALAAYVGKTRLIDNVTVVTDGPSVSSDLRRESPCNA